MPSKRIIIIFSVLVGLMIIVILACTLFNLKKVELSFENTAASECFKTDKQQQELHDYAMRYQGKNLLFLSERKMAEDVSSVSPYILAIDVERVFPNKVILHVSGREEMFIIKLSEDGYFVCDSMGVVLRKTTVNEDNTSLKKPNVLVSGVTVSEVGEVKIGSRLAMKDARKLDFACGIFDGLMSFAQPDTYTPIQIKDFIAEIDVSNVRGVVIHTRNNGASGVRIKLDEQSDKITAQMQLAVGVYKKLADYEKSYGTILIYPDKSQALGFSAAYSPEG